MAFRRRIGVNMRETGAALRYLCCRCVVVGVLLLLSSGRAWCDETPSQAAAAKPAESLQVGGAYADITPTVEMRNYKSDPLRPDKDACPLRVQVIVCGTGMDKAAIVSADCTFLGRTEVLRIRDALRWRIGIDPDR